MASNIDGISWDQVPVLISAVGALGFAAMGMVEAIGKALLVFDVPWAKRTQRVFGLPYAGYGPVKRLIARVGPALEVSYGKNYAAILIGQYKAGRGAGQAPDTIRQGVRLGLPYLSATKAESVVSAVWGISSDLTHDFARSVTARGTDGAPAALPADTAQSLAARFATALDTSVQAAFDSAEQDYQAWARFWAGVAAVGLSLAYYATNPGTGGRTFGGWVLAALVGLAAVPLAPVAKDLSTSLSQALTALGQVRGKRS